MRLMCVLVVSLFCLSNNAQDLKIEEEALTIHYNTYSRSDFESVKITKAIIKQSSGKGDEDFIVRECPEKEWKTILSHLDKMSWEVLRNLEAPTKKRLYDGAKHAVLEVSYKEKVYKTPSFDHGFPPEEIKALVNHIVALGESIE